MVTTEIKFLFQGIIFTANAHVLQESTAQKEIIVRFNTRYLINHFRQFYKFTVFGTRFAALFGTNELEYELIHAVQQAILSHPALLSDNEKNTPHNSGNLRTVFQ